MDDQELIAAVSALREEVASLRASIRPPTPPTPPSPPSGGDGIILQVLRDLLIAERERADRLEVALRERPPAGSVSEVLEAAVQISELSQSGSIKEIIEAVLPVLADKKKGG